MKWLDKLANSEKVNFIFTSLIAVLVALFIIKVCNFIIDRILKKADSKDVHWKFLKRILEAIIVLLAIIYVVKDLPGFSTFSTAILTSSGLIVAVLGFAAQESLSNIIHGIFISIFKPFKIGDRITISSETITGIIEDITLRHTVIKTYENTRVIIPNSSMDTVVIENYNFEDMKIRTYLDVLVTYDSDIDKASEIISEIISGHPNTIDPRTAEEKKKGVQEVKVFVRDLADSGIALRAGVFTGNINDSFSTCSDIRKVLVKRFKEEGIGIAYPTMTLLPEMKNKK